MDFFVQTIAVLTIVAVMMGFRLSFLLALDLLVVFEPLKDCAIAVDVFSQLLIFAVQFFDDF